MSRASHLVVLLVALLPTACRTPSPPAPPTAQARGDRPLNVGFLLIEGVYNTELTAPFDILQHTVFHTKPGMRTFTVSPSRDVVTTFEGLELVPEHTFDDAPPIDILVVPSAEHNMDTDLEDERLIAWVRDTGREADWVLSLCDGAFVLAEAGLLDGKKATTFPSDIPRMREMYSDRIDVLEGVSFVHDGKAITSVGGAQSFEPALYLCQILYGEQVARGIGRGLVIDWDLSKLDTHLTGSSPSR